jgi:hypothetical protein
MFIFFLSRHVPPPFLFLLLQPTAGVPVSLHVVRCSPPPIIFFTPLLGSLTCVVLGEELRGGERRKREGEKERNSGFH